MYRQESDSSNLLDWVGSQFSQRIFYFIYLVGLIQLQHTNKSYQGLTTALTGMQKYNKVYTNRWVVSAWINVSALNLKFMTFCQLLWSGNNYNTKFDFYKSPDSNEE